MLRTFLAALGAIFALMLVFLTSFLCRIAYDMDANGRAYEQLAVTITRDLSRSWSVDDIRTHYALPVAHKLSAPATRRAFASLKPLGSLRYVDDLTHRTRWRRDSLAGLSSPAEGAEMLAELLRKTVRVTFVAKFDNGFADVTIELRSEGGVMKLWHLQIDSQDHLPRPERDLPLAISRA
jgi:hypothetical protein